MRRSMLIGAAVLLALNSSIVRADFTDLPDPGSDGSGTTQPPISQPQPGGEQQFAGSLNIDSVSRRTGGALYIVKLQKALELIQLDIRITESKAKIYNVTAVTAEGRRLAVTQLQNTAVLETGTLASSENLKKFGRIAMVEIQAESFSAEANLLVTAVSGSEIPRLSLGDDVLPPPTTNPDPGPTPLPTPTPGPTPAPTPAPTPTPTPGEGGGTIPDSVFQVNDRVLYNSNAVGTVRRILSADKVEVEFDNGRRERAETLFLEKSAPCVDGFCEGRKVFYNGSRSTIVNIFPSGWVYIAMEDGHKKVVDSFFLSDAVECDERTGLCIGDAILYQSRYDGILVRFVPNGMAEVRLNGSNARQTARLDQLALSMRCTDKLAVQVCVGDRVRIQTAGGTVLGIYSNNSAKVQLERPDRILWVEHRSLVKTLRCVKSICVGHKVWYGNKQATVKELYTNNTALVTIGVLGKEYLVRTDSLRP